jgi:putative FmdB family regulatory protein
VPTYDYECRSCGNRFEKRQSFSDEPTAECPRCQSASRRLFHPAPIIFKGSGFYVTDSRKPGDFGGDGHGDADKSDAGQEKPADQKKPTGEEKTAAGKEPGGAKE